MDKEAIKLEEVVIAAWLHDVGKFAQRADIQELYNKNSEGMYCKTTKDGRYTHQHVVYTEGFLNKYKNVLPDGLNVTNIKNLAANHHNPSSYYDWIIAEADRLSSGSDRCNILGIAQTKDESEFDEEKNKLKFYEKPMIHILSTLKLDDKKTENAFCKMLPLENANIIPSLDCKTSKEEYLNLWKKFSSDFEKLQGLDYDEFLLSLNTLLERYWWCIPSATNADADISLYQHSKTTAAFAAALFQYHKSENTENEQALQTDDKKFLFINGDMSGIQSYIFDLKTSSDNAKLLRAKSFQLWALSEIVSQYITKKFNVTYANIMTSAGGKFIILIPNTTENRTKLLPQLQLEIEEYFLNEFAGKLTLIISDGTQADYSDLKSEKVQLLINKIGDDCDISKSKKMQKVLKSKGFVLDKLYEKLQINGECPKCGVFPASNPEGNDEERQCKSCSKLIEIGGKLIKSAKVILKCEKLCHFSDMVQLYEWEDRDLKFYYSVNEYKAGQPLMNLPYVAPKFEYFSEDEKSALSVFGQRNEIIEDSDLLTFEEISNLSFGNKKLAMFKADIDNLGLVFSQSFGGRLSFSRYADLSHQLHYFFSSFYAWFVNNHTDSSGMPYKNRIYTVFSGGDDLCILGSWDAVMQFALDFQKELCKFTNNNPSVTISGGIALVNSKLPVRNIAEEAESLLDASKGKDGKNAITVFGTTVSWSEYEQCLKDGKFLDKMLKENKISTGVVYKFIDFANRAERTLGTKNGIADVSELVNLNTKDRIWKSNMIYILARNVTDKGLHEKLKGFGANAESMIKSRIAVSYALYMNRK